MSDATREKRMSVDAAADLIRGPTGIEDEAWGKALAGLPRETADPGSILEDISEAHRKIVERGAR